jgi:hypothetical protein
MTSEKDMVESGEMASPKECAGVASCVSSPGEVVATTATREIWAGAGTDWRQSCEGDGDGGFALAGAVVVVTLVWALTIGATPPIRSPASAEPIFLFDVAHAPVESCSSCPSRSSVLGGCRCASVSLLFVLDRPRGWSL